MENESTREGGYALVLSDLKAKRAKVMAKIIKNLEQLDINATNVEPQAQVVSLKEGMVRKGGKNPPPSQAEILARPPAPAPMRIITIDTILSDIEKLEKRSGLNLSGAVGVLQAARANMQGKTK